MKPTALIVLIVLASFLLSIAPAGAQPLGMLPLSGTLQLPGTLAVTLVGGAGQLDTGSFFGVKYVSIAWTISGHTVNEQKGSLSIDGERTPCTSISNIVNCAQATLSCVDGDHQVVTGGPGVGSIDGHVLTEGSIHMFCFAH